MWVKTIDKNVIINLDKATMVKVFKKDNLFFVGAVIGNMSYKLQTFKTKRQVEDYLDAICGEYEE